MPESLAAAGLGVNVKAALWESEDSNEVSMPASR